MNWTKIIKNYNEWLSLPLALVLFFIVPKCYRWIDPTAGAFDAGVFHSNIYAIATLSLFSGISWFMMWLKFPVLKKYLDDDAEDDLIDGSPKDQKAAITAFIVYFSFILLLYLISNTL